MMRRLGAMIGIVVLLGLVFALVWRVYEHRKNSDEYDEPALVEMGSLPDRANREPELATLQILGRLQRPRVDHAQ